ncbi:hypothetical protein ABZZ74_40655 [Streptomyces sp. NPDC006476]|uniref:hypothetical protein n=1 Tax=Streptomyces sp. NPDC006476 TaxID=3157175 RepID=UPI0033B374C1
MILTAIRCCLVDEVGGCVPALVKAVRCCRYRSWDIKEGRRGLEGVITCDHPAVRYVLDGTRSHLIRPRRGKTLRFVVDGQVVFSAYARHPGTRPNNSLARALRLGR